ncbi:MNIO family bufferin maturase [Andreprevotia chitinilytica]|uniref:MNIO family bufferin maturase n=1 Tax=Andreprevotia chitinilytica TaxID=396808 RepID=UPI00068C3337|nr:DUF692 domain-containing protein [Andreprevotia chitinilytica]
MQQSPPSPQLGLGFRHTHVDHILTHWPQVDWFEVISENFMFSQGRPRHVLRQIAERYPLVMHGVSMSIGSTDSLDFDYLRALKALAAEVQPMWVSDHLCWTGILGKNTHDLLPLPLTDETLQHVASRIRTVQDVLERPLVLENPSSYLSYTMSSWSEPAFLAELVAQTGCQLLFDVNNCYVSCFNAGLDPVQYLQALPHQAIVQLHLAGHQHCGTHIIDTHDRPVAAPVWDLFHQAWALCDHPAILLEWDGNIPSFDTCLTELHKAAHYIRGTMPALDTSPIRPEAEAISTPVDFLIAPLMGEARQTAANDMEPQNAAHV